MTIEKVKIETGTRYDRAEDSYHDEPVDILTLEISLPGGVAKYSIDLPPGMKANLEFAAKLAQTK